MMEVVAAIPPFERFYEERKDEIFGYLSRLLGREAAEDAFQETFLRALRAYGKLEHGRHLRAWAFTIATRVAVDERRRAVPVLEPREVPVADERPEAARQAASSGVRRLRRRQTT